MDGDQVWNLSHGRYGPLNTPLSGPQGPAQHPLHAMSWKASWAVGSYLFCYVEGVTVGLRVQPAAAKGLPQNGIIGFLDAL